VEVKRHVGYVPGEPPQFGGLRGREVIAYLGAMAGGVDQAHVKELSDRLQLDLSRRYRQYSMGNKKKLLLVIAFMHRPWLLVLDERTSDLDPLNQQEFYAMVRDAKRGGAMIFLSSHEWLPTWPPIRSSTTACTTYSTRCSREASLGRSVSVMSSDSGMQLGRRSPLKFFLLVFVLSIPFWLIGAVTARQLSPDLPVAAFIFVCPAIAAAILVYRESGLAGVTALLRRSFDYRRIRAKAWYVPIVLLMPGIYALTYGLLRLIGLHAPTPQFPVVAALATFLAFFIAGELEELGWSGYTIDPLQDRWNALQASILLGLVWAAFHYVPLVQAHRSPAWMVWWSLSTVTSRVLFVWLYNNAGKSVFAAALFHAMANLSNIGPFLDFGSSGYPYDAQRISSVIIAFTAAIVTVAWGPRTLTRESRSVAPAGPGRRAARGRG
jgi:membrane protease YdiL (CAAX protease family)